MDFSELEFLNDSQGPQINVPPSRKGALWKVIVSEIKCPNCSGNRTKAHTGKRINGQGLSEHYRRCENCEIKFRVVYE